MTPGSTTPLPRPWGRRAPSPHGLRSTAAGPVRTVVLRGHQPRAGPCGARDDLAPGGPGARARGGGGLPRPWGGSRGGGRTGRSAPRPARAGAPGGVSRRLLGGETATLIGDRQAALEVVVHRHAGLGLAQAAASGQDLPRVRAPAHGVLGRHGALVLAAAERREAAERHTGPGAGRRLRGWRCARRLQVAPVLDGGPSVGRRGPGPHRLADLCGAGGPGRAAPLAVGQRRPPSCRYAASSRRPCRTETANTVAASAALISPRSIRWSTSTRFWSRLVNVTLSFRLPG
jgi:hypothetical protein